MQVKEKTSRIDIRVSPADKAACELRAKEAGLTLSAWIRVRLLIDRAKATT